MTLASHEHRNVKHAVIDASTIGVTKIVTAVTGKHILVVSYCLAPDNNVAVKFISGEGVGGGGDTDLTGLMTLRTGSSATETLNPGVCMGGLMKTDKGKALSISLTLGIQVSGHVSYIESDF